MTMRCNVVHDVKQIWESACKLLEERLSADVYERWIGVIRANSLKDGVITLEVSNDFYSSWLEENYLPLINDAIVAVHSEALEIQIVVNRRPVERADLSGVSGVAAASDQEDAGIDSGPSAEPTWPIQQVVAEAAPAGPSPAQKAQAKALVNTTLKKNYTFDNFVVGQSNRFAHAACLAVANAPAKAYNPLFIYGRSGLGKTHLMQAIGNHAAENGHRVMYLSSEVFLNEYIESIAQKSSVQFRRKYRNNCDILLIDDIHFLGGKESIQEEFFHTFNTLFDSLKQIVLTSDRPAAEIPGLEARLVSRFEWGLVTEMEPPDMETRMAILKKKKEVMEIQLEDDALTFLAEHITTNVRRLEGALVRAVSYASVTGIELTPESLEELLKDTLDTDVQAAIISVNSIQRLVCDYYDISMNDIRSKRRPASIAFPRQVAMYLCRQLTSHSLPDIGQAFDKNHATVLHACRMIASKMDNDPAVRQTLTQLREKVVKENQRRAAQQN